MIACVVAALLAADSDIWSPYDRFSAPDESCEVRAVLPGPRGTTWLGTTCNRLDGQPIGPLVLVDAAGKRVSSPLPDDRMRELSQLLAVGDGWVATFHSREESAPYLESVNYPAGHHLVRLDAKGARDEKFNAAIEAAFASQLGKEWGYLDLAATAKGELIALAMQGGRSDDDLKKFQVRALRFDKAGKVTAQLDLNAALASLELGYWKVLQVSPRSDGGLFVSGFFETVTRPRTRVNLVAFDAKWKPDEKFNAAFAKAFGGDPALEVRLMFPAGGGGLWVIGRHGEANVVRVTASGQLDATFKPFTMPGEHPQGRFLEPELAGLGPDGALWVGYRLLAGKTPPLAHPGLVKLSPAGAVDAKLQAALGKGVWDEGALKAKDKYASGLMRLLAPQPDGSVVIDGRFDHVGEVAVKGPVRVKVDGTLDAAWAPKLSTEVPAKKVIVSAKTSAFFTADGKPHFIACRKPSGEVFTYLYQLQADPWGNNPSCAVHIAGDVAGPGGPWQSCDAMAQKDVDGGAKCAETSKNPLWLEGR